MIEIKNLTKKFESVKAVDHLSLTIQPGVTGLVGHNGAGKSTLFRTIADVLAKDEGEVYIDGFSNETVEAKAKVFFLSDNPPMPAGANTKSLYDFYANFFDADKEKYYALIKKFSLPLDQKIGNYSKGMKRQLFLSLALSMKADYLLLDEAFDGIDPLVLEYIKEEIVKLAEAGKTIVVSSHNIQSLERLVDRFVILYKGQLSKEGESEHMSKEFVKFQAIAPIEITEDFLSKNGFEVVSIRKVGSIVNFVLLNEDDVEERLKDVVHPTLLEKIPVEPDEIIALEMMLAKKEGERHE